MINIIHNRDNTKRYDVLMYELKRQGIDEFHIWDSIHDVKSVEAGINAAHKQIVQAAKENELPSVVIAEDDIQFTDEGAYKYFLQNEPQDYDIYLGGIFFGKVENGIAEQFTGMTLYKVKQRFYDTFLSTANHLHIDHSLAGLGKYVVCEPFVCRQYNGYSSNSKRYENYDIIFENRKMFKRL